MPGAFKSSKVMFENLVKHLVDLEAEKSKLVDELFPEPSPERHKFIELIEAYITQVDHLVRNALVTEAADNCLPFVTIGSEVEVQDLGNQEIYRLQLVHPFRGSGPSRVAEVSDVSYLSPVGRSLLLKKVGDKVEVEAPGGTFTYKIKSIRYHAPAIAHAPREG